MLPLLENHKELIGSIIYQYSGILIDRLSKKTLEQKVAEQIKTHSFPSIVHYIELLSKHKDDSFLIDELLSEITINESFFFRNPAQFQYLYNYFLPELIKRKGENFTCRIWSAGCARGEEPYSMALLINHFSKKYPKVKFILNAGDISKKNIKYAKMGKYKSHSLKNDVREFERLANTILGYAHTDNTYKINSQLLGLIDFCYLNLKEKQCLKTMAASDIIFCRNVMIYFDDTFRKALIENLHSCLNMGGLLLLGESECLPFDTLGFDVIPHKNSYLYKKIEKKN